MKRMMFRLDSCGKFGFYGGLQVLRIDPVDFRTYIVFILAKGKAAMGIVFVGCLRCQHVIPSPDEEHLALNNAVTLLFGV